MGVVEKYIKKLKEDLNKGEGEMEEKEEQYLDDEYDNMFADLVTFIKALKNFGSKCIATPSFGGKMDLDAIMDWMKALEIHFECHGIIEEKKVKLSQSRMKGSTLTWWNF